MTVLPFHDELAFFGQGNHVDPVRIFQHVVFIIYHAVGQADFVAPGRQPRASDEVFAVEYFPFLFVVLHIVFRFKKF